jgi:O-antigen/teichoic acid export membrane protein
VAFVAACPGWTSNLLYHDGSEYPSRVIVASLACLPFLSLTHIHGTLLTAVQEIRLFLRITLVFACINIALNIFLIPRYGAWGCAMTALITQAAYALTTVVASHRRTGIPAHGSSMAMVAACGLAMFAAMTLGQRMGLPVLPTAMILAAALFVVFLRTVNIRMQDLLRLVKR